MPDPRIVTRRDAVIEVTATAICGAKVIGFSQTHALEALMEMTGGIGPDAMTDAQWPHSSACHSRRGLPGAAPRVRHSLSVQSCQPPPVAPEAARNTSRCGGRSGL